MFLFVCYTDPAPVPTCSVCGCVLAPPPLNHEGVFFFNHLLVMMAQTDRTLLLLSVVLSSFVWVLSWPNLREHDRTWRNQQQTSTKDSG